MPSPNPSTQNLYRILCLTLSDRSDTVDWPSLTPADWHALPALARREGVAPLLYYQLQHATYQVPAAVMDALAAEYYRTAAQNTLLLGELDRILAALDAAGTCAEQGRSIPVVVLKGAALAQTLYPDPALRPMNDSDLDVLAQESRRLLALRFFRERVLSLGKASRLAGLSRWELASEFDAASKLKAELDA